MEQHPIPRQITTFEFKLIGFMTLKQFLYLIIFFPAGFIAFKLFPIPLLNFVVGALVAAIGVALAFVPILDRPMDVWIKNMYKRLMSPTQFTYQKNNKALYFLQNLYFVSDPHKIMAQVETKEKLAAYLATTAPKAPTTRQKQHIGSLLQKPLQQLHAASPQAAPAVAPAAVISSAVPTAAPMVSPTAPIPTPAPAVALPVNIQPIASQEPVVQTISAAPQAVAAPSPVMTPAAPAKPTKPFLVGTIKNNRRIPLPGILIYIKDAQNKPLRLLKSNPHGIFATFNVLPAGDYIMEAKDPKAGYFFDPMTIHVAAENPHPFEMYSKEML